MYSIDQLKQHPHATEYKSEKSIRRKEMAKEVKYKVIDLFAGCGGLSLGLYQAGWEGVFAIEKNSFAFETLKYNLIDNKKHFAWPEWLPLTPHDINEVLKNYKSELKALQGSIDLVAGGPPCQGFSMAGKRVKDDVRNQLVFSYIKFIELVNPKMLLFENVKGFTYAFNKKGCDDGVPYSQVVIDKLKGLGYDVQPHIIDFSKYGVPQRRKRFILVGVQKKIGKASDFEAILESQKSIFFEEKGINETTTLKEAISDLLQKNGVFPSPDRKGFMSGVYGKAESSYQILLRGDYAQKGQLADSHSYAKQTVDKINSYIKLLDEYPTKGKRIDGKAREGWNIKQRGITVLDPNTIAPTITGHPDDYLHYCEPRIMTVRECARIQSFPDWFEIKKKYTTGGQMRKIEVPRYTQIGNAIPPLFAELAGVVLKKMLDGQTKF